MSSEAEQNEDPEWSEDDGGIYKDEWFPAGDTTRDEAEEKSSESVAAIK